MLRRTRGLRNCRVCDADCSTFAATWELLEQKIELHPADCMNATSGTDRYPERKRDKRWNSRLSQFDFWRLCGPLRVFFLAVVGSILATTAWYFQKKIVASWKPFGGANKSSERAAFMDAHLLSEGPLEEERWNYGFCRVIIKRSCCWTPSYGWILSSGWAVVRKQLLHNIHE